MKKKMLALCLSLVMVVSLLAACGGGSSSTGSTSTPATSTGDSSTPAPATSGGEIRINTTSEPPMMNSILTTSTGSMNVLRHIVDGLTILDQEDVPVPGVAESWDYDEETLTYTFHLRQGMKWNNGEEVTAHDFVFAWTQLFTESVAAPYADTWAPLILGAKEMLHPGDYAMTPELNGQIEELNYTNGIGFQADDDYTLRVTMTGPYPYFLSVMAFPNFMPVNQKFYDEVGADAYGTEADMIGTNGAYNMTSWTHESSIVLEKNPNYWDAASINLDKITMEMISDMGTAYNSLVAGDLDMTLLSSEYSQQWESQGNEVLFYEDASCWYFEFNGNGKTPGLTNKKVRQALTLAVDAEAFISSVVANHSSVAYSFVPSAVNNGEFTAAVGKLIDRVTDGDYSDVKALFEEGLAEEGLTPADVKYTIICDDTTTAAKYSAFFQEQWKTNLGIDVAVEQMTYKNRIERMQNHEFDIVMAGWGPDYNDPMTFLDLFVTGNGNNHTSYANPEYDQLVADAMAEADAAKRQQIMVEIEKILMDDMPVGPIYNRASDYACSEKLKGVVRTGFDDLNLRWAYLAA